MFLIIAAVIWLALSFFALYWVLKTISKYKNMKRIPESEIPERWKGFFRKDYGKWNNTKMIINCFIRFPLNFLLLSHVIVSYLFMILIVYPLGVIGRNIFYYFARYYCTLILRIVYDIREKKPVRSLLITTPIVISNHTCWLDPLFFMAHSWPISIVSKAGVKKVPVIGWVADAIETVYIERGSEQARNKVVERIKERVNKFNQDKAKGLYQKVKPILVFPEGTTSNGTSLLTFKNGAFNELTPITLFTLVYKCPDFDWGMDEIQTIEHVFLSITLNPTIQVDYTTIEAEKDDSPDSYAERCRQKMKEMTGFVTYPSGFRDRQEYEKALKQNQAKYKNE